jgi:phosphate transport system ATP-binding protein
MQNMPSSTHNEIETIYALKDFYLSYATTTALKGIQMHIRKNKVTAIIGPSGCGKSTLLKSLNQLVTLNASVKTSGKIMFNGQNVNEKAHAVEHLRTFVGMVFQKPNPFYKSIFDNVAFGPRLQGVKKKQVLYPIVEKALKQAALWDEVKDRLHEKATTLSGGQQQRLCIARCLAVEPEVILMDEPTSALDPIATLKIEQLICELKDNYTIIIVTHNMQQAARISDQTAFLLNGELIEMDETNVIFHNPQDARTEAYITGRFG